MKNGIYACVIILIFKVCFTGTSLFAQERRPGKLFSPEKIPLLESPRDWQDSKEIMDRLDIKRGDRVADIGAGSGYFTIPLAERVGREGIVYAEDIQQEMLDYISRKVEKLKIKNIKIVLGEREDPTLPDNSLNYAFVANTYHEVVSPFLLLGNIYKDLKTGGRLVIIDWDPEKKSPFGPPREVRVPGETVIKEALETGFCFWQSHNFMPYHYFLIFTK